MPRIVDPDEADVPPPEPEPERPPVHWNPTGWTEWYMRPEDNPRPRTVYHRARVEPEFYDSDEDRYWTASFTNPHSSSGQNWVANGIPGLGSTETPSSWPPPDELAGNRGMPSANMATYAILAYLERAIADNRRYAEDPYLSRQDRAHYQGIVNNLESAQAFYRQFSVCACACEECYVPAIRPPCGCSQTHCSECYPDGPPDWCECDECNPPQIDDLDDPDDPDFTGLPDIVAPPGRVRFGIEIEFNRQRSQDAQALRSSIMSTLVRSGLAVADIGYTHEVTRCWKMTTDASVSGGELVSPIMSGSDESIEEVREALRVVKACGGVTDRQVGMHVHLDVSRFRTSQLKALAENMRRAEYMLAAYVPDHRTDGSNSCGAHFYQDGEWDELLDWVETVDPARHVRSRENRERSCPIYRYRSINFNSLLNYGTVEVRLLGHTLNTVKVRTWIRALQTLVDASSRRALVRGDGLEWLVEHGLEPEHADRFRDIATRRGHADWLVVAEAA